MTQQDRDRLVALKKANKGLITQRQAAEEIGQSERHVRRLLRRLKRKGDAALVHALRGRRSNRKLDEKTKQSALEILGRKVYAGFGPTLAAEHLAGKHDIHVGRETVRHWMIEAKLWRAQRQSIGKIHQWRQRRSRVGELVQWDTSEHAWLEKRGPKLYLIGMIDDASSRVHARFAMHDSTEENMRLLWSYLELYGRPIGFYTDKASLFQTAPKIARDLKELPRDEREPLPPTQIGRALAELDIVWIARDDIRAGLRGAGVRVEFRLDASLAVRFRGCYLTVSECHARPKVSPEPKARKTKMQPSSAPRPKSQWMKNFIHTSPEKAALSGLLPPLPAPAAKPIRKAGQKQPVQLSRL